MLKENPQNKAAAKRLWLFAVALFVLSALVRFWLADFTKAMLVYPDEARYLHIARSLWQTGAIELRGAPVSYSKIFYSLLLAPVFSLGGATAQLWAIALVNSLVMSSAVFPALLLAKGLLTKSWQVLAVLGLCVLLPDMAYTMTFMSEVASYPLCLWLVYLLVRLHAAGGRRRYLLCALGGLLNYLYYLNKEIALAYLIVFFLYSLYTWRCLGRPLAQALAGLALYTGVFLALHLLLSLTLFAGMGASYDQSGLAYMDSAFKWGYLFYALFVNTVMAGLAFFVFPVLLPAARCKKLDDQTRVLYLLCLAALAVCVATVSYTISVREDLGRVMPRQHIRYFAPLFIPLVICMIRALEAGARVLTTIKRRLAWGATGLLCVVSALVLNHQSDGRSIVDNITFKYTEAVFSNNNFFPTVTVAGLPVHLGLLLLRTLVVAGVVGGVWLLLHKRARLFGAGFAGLVALLCVFNSYAAGATFQEPGHYTADPAMAAELEALSAQVETLEGNVLVLYGDELGPVSRLQDTYLTAPGLHYAQGWLLCERFADGVVPAAGGALNRPLAALADYSTAQPIQGIDYLLVYLEGDYLPEEGSFALLAEGEHFLLVQNLDPAYIYFRPR